MLLIYPSNQLSPKDNHHKQYGLELMTVTVLAMVTFAENQEAALSRYLEVTAPLLEQAKATVISMFDLNEAVVGHRPAKRMIVVEYPSRAAVDLVFESPEYKALIPTRDRAFTSYDISIAEQLS
jgi:uncharacterized protein (DUF1330 family)